MQKHDDIVATAVHVDLANVFMDLNKHESTMKEKNKAQRKLAARRGIEAHNEKRQLEATLEEFWEGI